MRRELFCLAFVFAAEWAGLPATTHAQVPAPRADYQFEGSLNDSTGHLGPVTLTATGGSAMYTAATVNGQSQQSLSLSASGITTPASPFTDPAQSQYSIVLTSEISIGVGSTTVTKVFDFKNLSSDAGLYIDDATGFLQFIDGSSVIVPGATSAIPVVTGTYFELALTRTTAGLVTVYQNGAQAFQFSDTGNLSTLNTALTVFQDDKLGPSGSAESTTGAIADLQLYNEVLTPTQVAALVPEPSTWATLCCGAAALGALALRRRMVPS